MIKGHRLRTVICLLYLTRFSYTDGRIKKTNKHILPSIHLPPTNCKETTNNTYTKKALTFVIYFERTTHSMTISYWKVKLANFVLCCPLLFGLACHDTFFYTPTCTAHLQITRLKLNCLSWIRCSIFQLKCIVYIISYVNIYMCKCFCVTEINSPWILGTIITIAIVAIMKFYSMKRKKLNLNWPGDNSQAVLSWASVWVRFWLHIPTSGSD